MASKKRSSAYWKKRFELIEQSQHRIGKQAYAEIEEQYRRAQRSIESQINAWYGRFATNNGVTLAEARRMLSARELAELKWDVQDYIRYGQENAVNGQWIRELENASARFHISRLEALKLQTQQSLEVMFGNQLDTLDATMREVYKSGYYRTAYEIQRGVGVGWDFSTLNDRTISKVINKPWAADGANFSARVWNDRQKLVNELNRSLTRNIVLGQDPQKAIDEIARKMNTSKNNAGRLVMTEEAFFSSAAQKDCFTELDVEQYEIVATLDSHTSEICQEMDGKHFPMSQWEVGITAPPFHVWCRTTTVPFFDDEFDNVGERAARGDDGKTYQVPADMTYKQWKEQFVDGGDKSGLNEIKLDDTIKTTETDADAKQFSLAEETRNFDDLKEYMKQTYGIEIDDSVGKLDFQSVREGVSGVEYVIEQFPQAKDSFKTIGTKKQGLMCAGYDGDINFNPGYYQTRRSALLNHGIGDGITQSNLHPKGNNCFGSGCHEAGHILEKALIDKINGGESLLGRLQWNDMSITKAIISDACKVVKKLSECKGMTIGALKNQISRYAGEASKYSASETLAEAVCDVSLNGEDAAPLSKAIWDILKKELE